MEAPITVKLEKLLAKRWGVLRQKPAPGNKQLLDKVKRHL